MKTRHLATLCKAAVSLPPAATVVMEPSPVTLTGVSRWVAVPSPSWPALFEPHVHTEPSFVSAIEW